MDNETWEKLEKFMDDNGIPYEVNLVARLASEAIYEVSLPYIVEKWD